MDRFLKRLLAFTILFTVLFFLSCLAYENSTTYLLPRLVEETEIEDLNQQGLHLVKRHWVRPGSIPEEEDLQDFQKVLSELAKFDFSNLDEEISRLEEMADDAYHVNQIRRNRSYSFYQTWQSRVGGETAGRLHDLFFGAGLNSIATRCNAIDGRIYALEGARNVLPRQRLNFAIALYLADETPRAIKQLRLIMNESPDYCPSNDFYIVAGRLKAIDDPEFLAEFEGLGLDVNRLRAHYTNKHIELYPYQLYDSSLPAR